MSYQDPCCDKNYPPCHDKGYTPCHDKGKSPQFSLLVVLFILLIIIGASMTSTHY